MSNLGQVVICHGPVSMESAALIARVYSAVVLMSLLHSVCEVLKLLPQSGQVYCESVQAFLV